MYHNNLTHINIVTDFYHTLNQLKNLQQIENNVVAKVMHYSKYILKEVANALGIFKIFWKQT